MKSIRDRFWELRLAESMVNTNHITAEKHRKEYLERYDILNKEFFNGELNISMDINNNNNFPKWTGFVEFKYILINERTLIMSEELISYLEGLYELNNIKHKIERIYEIN